MSNTAQFLGQLNQLDRDLCLLNKELHRQGAKDTLSLHDDMQHIIPERFLKIESDPNVLLAIANAYLKHNDITSAQVWLSEALTNFPSEYFQFLADGILNNLFTTEEVLVNHRTHYWWISQYSRWRITQHMRFSHNCSGTVASLIRSRDQSKAFSVAVLKAMIRVIDDAMTQDGASYRYSDGHEEEIFSICVKPQLEKMGFPTDLINEVYVEKGFRNNHPVNPPDGF